MPDTEADSTHDSPSCGPRKGKKRAEPDDPDDFIPGRDGTFCKGGDGDVGFFRSDKFRVLIKGTEEDEVKGGPHREDGASNENEGSSEDEMLLEIKDYLADSPDEGGSKSQQGSPKSNRPSFAYQWKKQGGSGSRKGRHKYNVIRFRYRWKKRPILDEIYRRLIREPKSEFYKDEVFEAYMHEILAYADEFGNNPLVRRAREYFKHMDRDQYGEPEYDSDLEYILYNEDL